MRPRKKVCWAGLVLRPIEQAVICSYTQGSVVRSQTQNIDDIDALMCAMSHATLSRRWRWGTSHAVYIEQVEDLVDFLVNLFERNLAGQRDSGHLSPARGGRCYARACAAICLPS